MASRLLALPSRAAGAAGAAVLACWLFLAAAHVDDRYGLNHVAGVWMALTQHFVRTGSLYPPLFDGTRFGGTRLMPLQIVLNGAAARLTGEYVVSGKVVEYVVYGALLVLVYRVLRGFGCGRAISLALVGSVVASTTGTIAGSSIRGDALPVLLQLVAVVVVTRSRSTPSLAAASVLCALAVAAKFSALWAPAALVVYLLLRERRRALAFAIAFVLAAATLLGAFELTSHERMSRNVVGLAFAGGGGGLGALAEAPWRAFQATHWGDDVVIALAAVALLTAIRRRGLRIGVYEWSLVFAAAGVVVIFSDVGAGPNHLLDLQVLAAFAVGRLDVQAGPVLRAVLAGVVVVAIALAFEENLRSDVVSTARDRTYTIAPLLAYVPRGATLLSEDASIPVELGETPVVDDPFMLARLLQRHPSWDAALTRRIDQRRFARVVLLHPAGDRAAYTFAGHLGPEVARAIRRNYRLLRPQPIQLGGPTGLDYWVYAPR